MIKVCIDTPGPTVTVEAEGDLDVVAAKALELFQAAGGWPQVGGTPVGFTAAGSVTERASGPEYVSSHQVDMREGQ